MELPRKTLSAVLLLFLLLLATDVGPLVMVKARSCAVEDSDFKGCSSWWSPDNDGCVASCKSKGVEPGYCAGGGFCLCFAPC
ncbi:hypothetical protein EJB05_02603 [Eragrostis curvula]|uniref:Invertebrate defensins family profile domain-containing protein n=1 Tax=Eragrostis curvula TaxID=38414 RepID=A0A5J9WVQ5_9POAL|nr:hypothetical protein EJB05_02603 [Eragrostis curvula]